MFGDEEPSYAAMLAIDHTESFVRAELIMNA